MAQLNLFSGGLNTRLQPHLIATSEAVVYKNINNTTGVLEPTTGDTNTETTVDKTIINFKDTWISDSESVDYVEFQSVLYSSDGVNKPQKTSDGITWYNLGIEAPTSAPTVVDNGSGALDGTYQYSYTYYNDNDGTESAQSDYSDELIGNGFQVTVSPSTDAQVTNIRLYRLGGALSSMTLVTTLTNTAQTYTDTAADVDIAGNEVLDSFNNQPAPTGLTNLIENNAMLFGSVGPKLYYSDVAEPNYWSAFNFIDINDTITGIGVVSNGLLVFTKFETYIVTGTSPDVLSKYSLDNSQGCLLHKSIAYFTNTLVWVSSDGICLSAGSTIEVISRSKLGKLSLTPIASKVYDDQYHLSHSTGTLIVDVRFGNTIFKEQELIVDGFSVYNDELYYSKDLNLYKLGTDSNKLSFNWKSARYTEGSISEIKNYKTIYTYSEGDIEFKVYTDLGLLTTKTLNEGLTEIKVKQDERRGYWMQFEASGTGILHEIEYIVEGRTNGR